MPVTAEQLTLLNEWFTLKQQLKPLVDRESELRDIIAQELFDPTKIEGTETIGLFNEWKLKATKKLIYSLNNESGQVANICATLPDVVSRSLVRWKPDLILATWRKIDTQTQELFKEVLEIKPGKPTLELVAPKE